jgi:two-component system, chemotaxis family, protein-glutamate methylesterase/glutaminase
VKPRVLVVDDSAFARTTLAKLLRASGAVEVVGTARDGLDALEQIGKLDPDVVTLDLTMPELDGIGVLRALAGRARPRVIVVSISNADTELGAEALSLGAIDIVAKPTALASDRLTEVAAELIAKVVAAGSRVSAVAMPVAPTREVAHRADLAMIGTSTGGPQALTQLVAALPADLAIPVAIVLHIPVGYTDALARRLDRVSPLHVVEAAPDLELVPGIIVLARAGFHLRVARSPGGVLRCVVAPGPARQFVPSVDELFTSGAELLGSRALGVILTGMGDDGLAGARAIHARGGALVTESMSTCVVYGMPRVVDEARLGATSLPLDRIAGEIVRRA